MEKNVIQVDALVLGTGAAGYNAACRLRQEGVANVAIVTEGVCDGTSRNTGSDKQTYYKLGLGGDSMDSVRQMAQDLFVGGAVDGDNALCEAALSVRCFMNLVELGVPFPVNRYGEYVGYKTDHDPYARATSAGPLTSKFMTEALQIQAEKWNIPVYDRLYAIEILKDEDGVCGLLCLNKETDELVAFETGNIVLATGGPAGIYADNVYPACHTGSSSLAFLTGAEFQNMTEWQYGLASTQPRWNVSGTYMQVLPKFVSVDEQGIEREFLLEYFKKPCDALNMVFLKGYQWPFDSSKVMHGSSIIDLLVYRETALRNRKVYLDYQENPFGMKEIPFEKLSDETLNYLQGNDACFGKPIDRLIKMNLPAVELYRGKGVDLTKERLPIALCAQHNNGGIAVDLWWQTTVKGLFAAGECAGTHGIARPGGSALNAGQVGSLRAAQYIAGHKRGSSKAFPEILEEALQRNVQLCEYFRENPDNVDAAVVAARKQMSICGAAIRVPEKIDEARKAASKTLLMMEQCIGVGENALYTAYQLRDILVTQIATLEAMLNYSSVAKVTRGSALYYDPKGEKPEGMEESFRFTGNSKACAEMVQVGCWNDGKCEFHWRPVRPLPEENEAFETVWRSYRENKNVY